eukprot:606763-Pyramimonas_sp.AAC.1
MTSCSASALITDPSQASRYFRLTRLMISSRFVCQRALKLICSSSSAKKLTIISDKIYRIRLAPRT